MAKIKQADGILPSIRTARGEVESGSEMNEEFLTHLVPLDLRVGSAAAARFGVENGGASQTRPPAPRAGPAFTGPTPGYLSQVVDTLRACGILPETPAPAPVVAGEDVIDDDTDNADVNLEEEDEAEEETEEGQEEGAQRWNVWDENKESWGELCVISKPSRRVVGKGLPVKRVLVGVAEGKQAAAPLVAVSTIEANEKGKEEAVAEDTPTVDGHSSKVTVSRKIVTKGKEREEPPAVDGKNSEAEERHEIVVEADNRKTKATKDTSEVMVAVRTAKKVSQTKAVEHSIGTRRRKESVKATIRAKKVAQVREVGRKPSTQGRGAAKASITGSAVVTGRASLVLPPPKRTSKVKLTAGARPPLSASATHNTPSKSSAPKGDKGTESIAVELPAMKDVEQKDEATDANAKGDPSAAVTESVKEVNEKAPRRPTRNAEKSEVPKAKEVKVKPAAGRPKRKEMHEDDREERDRNKRAKDAPGEEQPEPKIMLHILKRLTREEIADVKAEKPEGSKEKPETIPETIAHGGPKLRRSARSKKASFKTLQK